MTAVLFHIGKAGGGTIWLKRLPKDWRVKLSRCHDYHHVRKEENKDKLTLVTLRDPVDRFVSAFYWAIIQGCDPEGDDRIAVKGAVHNRYKTHCSSGYADSPSFQVAYHESGHDVNNLAASLCSSDKDVAAAARTNLTKITHLQTQVTYWLDLNHTKTHNVFPVVMDSSVSGLEQQTDDFLIWLHNETQFENAASFSQRKARVRNLDAAAEQAKTVAKGPLINHSSHRKTNIPLLPENEKCMVHFFRKEYDFFATIKDAMCKSSDCQTGIQSILDRRRPLLLESSSSEKQKDSLPQ